MSQKYSFRVDKYPLLKERKDGDELYFGEGLNYKTGKGNSLDLYLRDGSRHCAQYSYMIYVRLEQEDNVQVMKLFQTTHMVIIKGFRLNGLYDKVRDQNLQYLKESNDTEIALADENEPFITKIEIDWRSKNQS